MRENIDIRTPNISLMESECAQHQLVQIFEYTKMVNTLLYGFDLEQLIGVLKRDLSLQHALIFCFKAIGMHADKASEHLRLEIYKRPLFWKNIHYLRNSLVHHSLSIKMSDHALNFLAKITVSTWQISKYFSLVLRTGNTQVDLQRKRYKVFTYIYRLAKLLKESEDISQTQYLEVVINAIQGIRSLTSQINVTADSLITLSKGGFEECKKYYALQNLCELIATIANPNDNTLLNEFTLLAIIQQNPDIAICLSSLRTSRGRAMHALGFIVPNKLVIHIRELCAMEPYFLSVLNSYSLGASTQVTLADRSVEPLSLPPTTVHKPLSYAEAVAFFPSEKKSKEANSSILPFKSKSRDLVYK